MLLELSRTAHGEEKYSLPVFKYNALVGRSSERSYLLLPFVSVEWSSSDWAR